MMPDVAKNRVYLHVLLLIVAGCRRMMVTIGSWYGSSCDLACDCSSVRSAVTCPAVRRTIRWSADGYARSA